MVCDICGQDGAQVRRVSRSYGRGADLFVIENVPLISCPRCCESYLAAETLHELERIKLHRRAMAQERDIVPESGRRRESFRRFYWVFSYTNLSH